MEATGSWAALKKDEDLLIVGLKELEEGDFPLVNAHTYFAHAFKGQEGWKVRSSWQWNIACFPPGVQTRPPARLPDVSMHSGPRRAGGGRGQVVPGAQSPGA